MHHKLCKQAWIFVVNKTTKEPKTVFDNVVPAQPLSLPINLRNINVSDVYLIRCRLLRAGQKLSVFAMKNIAGIRDKASGCAINIYRYFIAQEYVFFRGL
jgi:hypothetical protein